MSEKCVWSQEDEDSDTWVSDCGYYFTLNDESPLDNGFKFCCHCGKPIDEEHYHSEDDV